MIRTLAILLLTIVLPALHGCVRQTEPAGSQAGFARASDPQTGTEIETSVEQTTLGIADRIWVTTEWRWGQDVAPKLEDPDWGSADWTLVERIDTPPSKAGEWYRAQRRVLLEPFLPGAYTIPTGVLLIESSSLTGPIEITADPIEVSVTGVLPENDTGALNPIASPAPAAEPQSGSAGPLVYTGVVLAVVLALVTLILLRRNHGANLTPSIYETLVLIGDDRAGNREQAFAKLEHVFDRLDPRLRGTSEFAAMISACERARYAESDHKHASPARIALHALELLGHEQRRTTTKEALA